MDHHWKVGFQSEMQVFNVEFLLNIARGMLVIVVKPRFSHSDERAVAGVLSDRRKIELSFFFDIVRSGRGCIENPGETLCQLQSFFQRVFVGTDIDNRLDTCIFCP